MEDGDGGSSEEIGVIETTLSAIMGKKAQTFEGELLHNSKPNRGKIIVRAESTKQSNLTLKVQFNW